MYIIDDIKYLTFWWIEYDKNFSDNHEDCCLQADLSADNKTWQICLI